MIVLGTALSFPCAGDSVECAVSASSKGMNVLLSPSVSEATSHEPTRAGQVVEQDHVGKHRCKFFTK